MTRGERRRVAMGRETDHQFWFLVLEGQLVLVNTRVRL